MLELIESVLFAFDFFERQVEISLVCLIIFLCNFFGGLMRSVILAYGGPIKPRKLKDRMSFRLFLSSVLFLLIYAFYYHAFLIQSIEPTNLVYWGFALLATPLLAVISSQITALIFAEKIARNERAYRKLARARRERRREARRKSEDPNYKETERRENEERRKKEESQGTKPDRKGGESGNKK